MSVLLPFATVIATCRKLTWKEIVALYRLTLDQPPTLDLQAVHVDLAQRRVDRPAFAAEC